MSVYKPRASALGVLFGKPKAIIGVIHSRPLPGAPAYDGEPMDAIYDYAVREAARYAAGGMDGLIVENHGDIPFSKPEDLGPETAAAHGGDRRPGAARTGLPVGINVLANGALHALAVAKAAGACFVRVNQWANAYVANEGIIEGRRPGHALPSLAARSGVKHLRRRPRQARRPRHHRRPQHRGAHPRRRVLRRRRRHRHRPAHRRPRQARGDPALQGATELPLVVGSGVTEANVGAILERCDGVIVAASLKRDGVWWNEVDPERVKRFMDRARSAS